MLWLIPVGIIGGLIITITVALVTETVKQNKRYAETKAQNESACERIWEERLDDIKAALVNHGLSTFFADKCINPEAYLEAIRNYCPQAHMLTTKEGSLAKEQEMVETDTGIRIGGMAVTYESNKYNTYISLYRDFQTKVKKRCCPCCDYVRESKLYVYCTIDKEDGSTRAVHSIKDAWHALETFVSPSASIYFPTSFDDIFGNDIANTLNRKVQEALRK